MAKGSTVKNTSSWVNRFLGLDKPIRGQAPDSEGGSDFEGVGGI